MDPPLRSKNFHNSMNETQSPSICVGEMKSCFSHQRACLEYIHTYSREFPSPVLAASAHSSTITQSAGFARPEFSKEHVRLRAVPPKPDPWHRQVDFNNGLFRFSSLVVLLTFLVVCATDIFHLGHVSGDQTDQLNLPILLHILVRTYKRESFSGRVKVLRIGTHTAREKRVSTPEWSVHVCDWVCETMARTRSDSVVTTLTS